MAGGCSSSSCPKKGQKKKMGPVLRKKERCPKRGKGKTRSASRTGNEVFFRVRGAKWPIVLYFLGRLWADGEVPTSSVQQE